MALHRSCQFHQLQRDLASAHDDLAELTALDRTLAPAIKLIDLQWQPGRTLPTLHLAGMVIPVTSDTPHRVASALAEAAQLREATAEAA